MNQALRNPIIFCFFASLINSAAAVEFGPAVNYTKASESLNVNGRFVQLKSGGVGLRASESLFDQHVVVDISGLYGYTGSASATFSGANVSGPADLTTYKANLYLFLSPTSRATPYLRAGYTHQQGDTDFTGSRNGSPVVGKANLELENTEVALGFRMKAIEAVNLFGEIGQNDWRLDSDASGKIGALRARTQIQAQHTDPFFRIGMDVVYANWRGTMSFGEYQMTADNETKSRSIDASLMYVF